MARIPLLDEEDPATPPAARRLLREIDARRGGLINLYRALAYRPRFARAVADIYFAALAGGLSLGECELAYLSASVCNRCRYCTSTHTVIAARAGLSAERIRHIQDDPFPHGLYDAAEAAIIRYGRQSTLGVVVSDEIYAALEEQFTIEQIMDVWALVGLANMINRFHETFHTDLDPAIR